MWVQLLPFASTPVRQRPKEAESGQGLGYNQGLF